MPDSDGEITLITGQYLMKLRGKMVPIFWATLQRLTCSVTSSMMRSKSWLVCSAVTAR